MASTRIFVAWDSTLKSAVQTFRAIEEDPEPGVEVVILGAAGYVAFGQLDLKLRESIGPSDALLAIIDKPNANVAWELGWAMARGLRVAVATEGGGELPWVRGTPFAPMLQHRGVARGSEARKLLAVAGEWPRFDPVRMPGSRKVVVCPRHAAGEEWLRRLERELPQDGWEFVGAEGWTLADLPRQLAAADRVAWTILPPVEGEHRHGVGNAVGGLVAGYADGLGLSLVAVMYADSVDIADARHRRSDFDGTLAGLVSRIRAWSSGLDAPPLVHRDPLAEYRSRVHAVHANPLHYVGRLGLTATDLVPVDLDVEPGGDVDCLEGGGRRGPRAEGRPAGRLRVLVEDDFRSGSAPRWLVRAEPGAGKSTLLRQLAHDLSVEGERAVAVFVSLAEWEAHGGTLVEAALRQTGGGATGGGPEDRALSARLSALGVQRGAVWLFLDGFDEVRAHDTMRDRILGVARDRAWAGAALVVTSRAGAVERGSAWKDFTVASLRYLDDTQQHQLVRQLLGGSVPATDAFWRDMGARPGVAVLFRNPFLLTLSVGLHARAVEHEDLAPCDRTALLVRALDDCLERGWGNRDGQAARPRRWSTRGARHVLRALSLELHRRGGEAWTREALSDALGGLVARYPAVAKVYGRAGDFWLSDDEFLDDVQHYAGVLGPLDGPGLPWRYLHRSLREMLVAECLADEMEAEERGRVLDELLADATAEKPKRRVAAARPEVQPEDGPGRTAEVLALLVGRLMEVERDGRTFVIDPTEPIRHLERLVKVSPDAAVRALASVERIDAWEHLRLALSIPPPAEQSWQQVGWDGAQLDSILDAIGRGPAVERLWAAVRPELSTFHLGVLWYALERVEAQPASEGQRRWSASRRAQARQMFFDRCGRAAGPRPNIDGVEIGAGTFTMGSPTGIGEKREWPAHPVSVSPFRLARFPVTVEQYRAFDASAAGEPSHPVAEVDWFSARLYADWIGGRLPTEAEWEYACRAGTTTAYWSGDTEADLARVGWYNKNSGNRTHPVGEKAPNPWGLHDMHGNVLEWCSDWHGEYPPGSVIDPAGPPRGSFRVLRGGSCWVDADWCRSAFRNWILPDERGGNVGFRVLLPRPAPPSEG